MIDISLVQKIAVSVIPVIFAITVHEVAHGWVAYRLGDPTAKMLGRLTLNPIKHIDPVGTIIIPGILLILGGFVFGWAKPVPINWRNLKHKRRDVALVSIAGPLSNFIMAGFWAILYKILAGIYVDPLGIALAFLVMAQIGVLVNVVLLVLNLLPLPPLDGSRVVSSFLPRKLAYAYDRIEPYGFFILLLLLSTGLLGTIMDPLIEAFLRLLM